MNINEVINFFDKYAPSWDNNLKINEKIIDEILSTAGIKPGDSILDIACGTGVLFPFYLKAGVSEITGIDISPKMIDIAKTKFKNNNINLICGNAETYEFNKKFDNCMIFNALPHFINLDQLFFNIAKHMKKGAKLTIAHDKTREEINNHHKHKASGVSNELMEENKLASIMQKYFKVDLNLTKSSDIYIVTGEKL